MLMSETIYHPLINKSNETHLSKVLKIEIIIICISIHKHGTTEII